MILGIDAASVRHGGTVTHLVELLRAADPAAHGFTKVVVWAGEETLGRLEPRPWLERRSDPALDRGLLARVGWQWRTLPRRLREERCDVLFVPGGYHFDRFRPAVVLSQNLQLFVPAEIRRYRWSEGQLRFWLLRWATGWSIRRSAALITLSEHARVATVPYAAPPGGRVAVIPHGVDSRFFLAPRPARRIEECSADRPFRILYVSKLEPYKHQWHVAEAVARLGREGLPVSLELVGASIPSALTRLRRTLARVDPTGRWVTYLGAADHAALADRYQEADLFVFASSCEAFGLPLLEAMAAGLPILCADRSALPEVLGGAGAYVDPEDPEALAEGIRALVLDPGRRARLAADAGARARSFRWTRAATETFSLLAEVV